MDFSIPSELLAVRDTVRRFVQRELVPLERTYLDGMPYEEELRWRQRVRDMGLFMMHTPEEHGGSGINMLGMALVFEETAKTTMAADFLLGIDQPDPVGGRVGADREDPDHLDATEPLADALDPVYHQA